MKLKYLVILFLLTQCKTEPAEVTGVVTYFFNNNLGDKPDIGAKVYLLENTNKINHSSLDSFLTISVDKKNYKDLQDLKEMDIKLSALGIPTAKESLQMRADESEKVLKRLTLFNAETEEKYHLLDSRSNEQFLELISKSNMQTTVDGSGRFYIKVPPGEYTTLIVSNGREGNSITTIGGLISLDSIKLSSGEKKEINHAFGMQ